MKKLEAFPGGVDLMGRWRRHRIGCHGDDLETGRIFDEIKYATRDILPVDTFLETTLPIKVVFETGLDEPQVLAMMPRQHKKGSLGFYGNDKLLVMVNGKKFRVQATAVFTLIGSGEPTIEEEAESKKK